MKITKFRWILLMLLGSGLFLQSCDKEIVPLESQEVDNIVEEALQDIALQTRSGPNGCYEFVFPVTINLPNGTSHVVNSYEEMKEIIRRWASQNSRPPTWPHIAFPFDVMTDDGTIITINDREELVQLRRECTKDMDKRPPQTAPCFELLFPVILEMPDGNTIKVESREELHKIFRRYKEAFPNSVKRPKIGFPMHVLILETKRRVVINNKDELKRLREMCSG